MLKRGAVTYKSRARQGRDFRGLCYGQITPTDIDGLIEYHNRCYVIYEAKHVNAPTMSQGQRMALERLCDDLQNAKKEAIVIVCKHNTPADQEIDFAKCEVESYRRKGQWRQVKQGVTVKRITDSFIERYGNNA
jgi:hypothetical protein